MPFRKFNPHIAFEAFFIIEAIRHSLSSQSANGRLLEQSNAGFCIG
jgi:hypothetical protein